MLHCYLIISIRLYAVTLLMRPRTPGDYISRQVGPRVHNIGKQGPLQ